MYPSTNLTKSFMSSRIPNVNAQTLQYNRGPSEDLDTFAYHCRIFADTTHPPIPTSARPFIPYRIERQGFNKPTPKIHPVILPSPPPVLHSPVPDKVFVNVPFWLSGEYDWEAEVRFSTSISASPIINATITTTTEEVAGIEDATEDADSIGTSCFSSPSSRYSASSLSSFTSISCSTSTSTPPSSDIALPTPSTYIAPPDVSAADHEALLKASQLAERILELDNMEDSEAKREEMNRLFKTWEDVYAQIRSVVDVGLPGAHAGVAKN